MLGTKWRGEAAFQIKSQRDKMRALLRILRTADRNNENAIIYVNTTREAERLAQRLESRGLDARYYHGRMDDQARKDVQDMFIDGQINIIVATKAFGMGIDKQDIRYVIHYHIPSDIESYYQEAGRAGRDGEVSYCVLLYHKNDLWIHENYFIPKSLPEQEQVENVLDFLKRRFKEAKSPLPPFEKGGKGGIYISPVEIQEALGFDEERELGIHLHLLEELGFIKRNIDVTLKASARLLASLKTVASRARELATGPVGDAIERILEYQEISATSRDELRLVQGALQEGVEPTALDDVFYQLSIEGLLIYRAFARAYSIQSGPKMIEGVQLNLDEGEIGRVKNSRGGALCPPLPVKEEMEANLGAMRRYAELLSIGDCLREDILKYLGAKKPETRADECCSLCDVNLPVPWVDEPMWEDLTDPGKYNDAKYEVLKAVSWNARLENEKWRAPYGAWTLAQLLVGNDYMATKYETDKQKRKARRSLIMSSEYFGVLEGLSGAAETVRDLVEELQTEGYIQQINRQWEGGEYEYPAPTEKGYERIEEGRLFDES